MILIVVDPQRSVVDLELVNPVFMILALCFQHLKRFSLELFEVLERLRKRSNSRIHLLVKSIIHGQNLPMNLLV